MKQFTLEGSVEMANIKGGEGKPRVYSNVKSVEDEDWGNYLEWLKENEGRS